jgi:hypothetical protein
MLKSLCKIDCLEYFTYCGDIDYYFLFKKQGLPASVQEELWEFLKSYRHKWHTK